MFDSFDDFDDRVLPVGILHATFILCISTTVLQLYLLVSTILIYKMANRNKQFWRKEINLHKKEDEGRRKTNLEPKRFDLKSLEKNLKLMNWLESWLDKVVHKIKAFTTMSSSFQPSDVTNTLKSEHAISINWQKNEFEVQVVKYLEISQKEHKCGMCSITKDQTLKDICEKLYFQVFNLLGTFMCLIALLRNYNQLIFYLSGCWYIITALFMILMKSSDKWNTFKAIFSAEICGFEKVTYVNDNLVMLFADALFFCFVITFIFYCFRDETLMSQIQ